MADRKISDLTALTTPASGDYLPIVDISEAAAASKNKRITIEELMRGVPDGTAAAPGIAFETDPNTGIYSPGADQLAVATNGTGRLFVNSSGNVGIGTSAPGALLNLHGTFGTSLTTGLRIDGLGVTTDYVSPIAFYIQSSNWGTQHAANIACGTLTGLDGGGYLRFSTSPDGNTAPAERLRITATGLVGIGTTSPSSLLHLADAGNITVGTTTGTKIGTATTQKLGFWDKTPVVQPTTGISGATFVADSGGSIHPSSTFDGYTIAQVVAALRQLGILA